MDVVREVVIPLRSYNLRRTPDRNREAILIVSCLMKLTPPRLPRLSAIGYRLSAIGYRLSAGPGTLCRRGRYYIGIKLGSSIINVLF